MDWECRECGRVHDEDPGTCACGSEDVRPGRAPVDGLDRARRLLVDPDSVDAGLGTAGPAVSVAFRLIVAFMVVVSLAVLAAWLL